MCRFITYTGYELLLTHFSHQWQTVPADHLIIVDADYSVQIHPIKSI